MIRCAVEYASKRAVQKLISIFGYSQSHAFPMDFTPFIMELASPGGSMHEFHAIYYGVGSPSASHASNPRLYCGVGPPSVPFCGTPIVLVTFSSCLLIMALTVGFEPTHQLLDLTV